MRVSLWRVVVMYFVLATFSGIAGAAILYAVGETVEHFTP